jgi:trehalose synthase
MSVASRQPVVEVAIAPLPIGRFAAVLDPGGYRDLLELGREARALLRGRTVWCVNSTVRGGGVAEMLRSLLGYTRDAGVDSRWIVVGGDPEFFRVTKRLHNRLHGADGDGGPLGESQLDAYARTLAPAAHDLAARVRPGDIVLLHDPQTAGLAAPMHALGAHVIWRSHIGADTPNDLVRHAWEFLAPMLESAEALVFSRERYVWSGLAGRRVTIIPPSIDVFSAKNQWLEPCAVHAILAAAGLQRNGVASDAVFLREDGTPGRVQRRARVIEEAPLTGDEPIVTQVSRWDRLKDPIGVLEGFARHTRGCEDAHLVLAGPAVEAVSDDPEGAKTLTEVADAWRALPVVARRRAHIACLPMDDGEENAAIVNALQTRADVVVQKSLAEGFGLTVAEAMWKRRPVVASAVGGIQDQIVDGSSGILLHDPADLQAYGDAVCRLLTNPALATRLGSAARDHVREHFLEPRHLAQWLKLFGELLQ